MMTYNTVPANKVSVGDVVNFPEDSYKTVRAIRPFGNGLLEGWVRIEGAAGALMVVPGDEIVQVRYSFLVQ